MNYWLWFASIEDIEVKTKHQLLEQYQTPEKIFHLKRKSGLNDKIWNSINNSKHQEEIDKIETKMKAYHVKMLTIQEKEYPEKLKRMIDPPICLFYVGNGELLQKSGIGIVGTRKATSYGLKSAFKIAKELSSHGIPIISGLAKGVDSSAHEGALMQEGGTIAVIGSGLDIAYPKENFTLYQKIMEKGLIVSEYVLGVKPYPLHFPARNRIISGLSDGIIVVEAGKHSGALITADFALEQGKNVYAVPGNIDSPQSTGTIELIKNGAIVYTGMEDLE